MALDTSQQAAITSGSDMWHTEAVESAGLPAVIVTDGPHGVRMQAEGDDLLAGVPATCFPPAVASASTWDPELLHRMGEALGDECRAQDVAVLLGPGVNLKRSPLGGRNFEYFSEDPILTGRLATEWVRGLQSKGVGASLKHFAVNSQETDRMRISADIDERTLREVYLRAFHKVVTRAQPWTVMCAYNKINGVYASEHHWLLTDVLRGEWGFEGLVVSDWGAVVDRVKAIAAGLDLTMPGPDLAGDQALVAAVSSGALDPALLATSAERVRRMIAKTGDRPAGTYDADAHHALAREIAGRAIVLLKNDGDLLPLTPGTEKVAVLGEFAWTPRYQGGGSSQITPTRLDDALTAIRATGAEVSFAAGYTVEGDSDEALLAEAAAVAREADVAIVFAGSVHETEGADRESIDLPAVQIALIERVAAANPKTVVVLSNGAVLATKPWDEKVPALVEGWLLGQAGGSAVADVLFGRVNPSGRLAETIPVKLADHPSYLDFPGEHGHVRYGEGLHVGYRGFDARGTAVAYPFGFGLSYTTFGYGAARATASPAGVEVRVPVTNTGSWDGREVVQVYVSRPGSAVRRAPRELKAFASVPITAGDTTEVTVTVEREDLAYWDTRLGRWIVEDGEYTIEVGASSRDIRATVTVHVAGDPARVPLTAESSIGEWFADPRGAEVLTAAFAAGSADGPMSAMVETPEMLMMLGSLPLSRMSAFPGSPIDAGDLDKLVEAAN
ncbi:glycoside hydrolase family 3 C-terminal domain-containing protein [Actinoplanes derwentensis]|uniref:Exo-alpha-(1->6)-L-arabinopyranosidase n=1 Tax=Actinoplanes derwentensis TaxID=113562 RepID=A0A1H2BQF9_9ACTN|nr:glycoside hydrolase family 3 C-terminal domain-containing protein [Actinoplanes derwentensis]GID83009.1 glycosyl hydrolase [Actinoplanes derwentensis]SDT60590.1 beta-glucosidase [Actinoplanes derwentensis]